MTKDVKDGRFVPNKNRFLETNGLIFCFHESGDLLFFTEAENREMVKSLTWRKYANGYAATDVGGRSVAAHRIIYGASADEMVDHRNGIKKDNRTTNLRGCNRSQNAYNSKRRKDNKSGYPGVYFRKDTMRWSAEIKNNNKKIMLGCFDTKEEAISARKKAEEEYAKEFARNEN